MVAVLQPVKPGKIIAIDRAVVLVGRSSDCDNVINGSQKISRRHCCLVQVDTDYYVRDLGSMNGVWLNNERVNREAKLSIGDRLTIGDVEFLFHPNARIEQKKNIAAPPKQPAASAPTKPKQPPSNSAAAQVDNEKHRPDRAASELARPPKNTGLNNVDDGSDLDDVIPLDELEREEAQQFETNEYEVIDEPIGDDDPRDDILMFDDEDDED